jgi:hypothetical protein
MLFSLRSVCWQTLALRPCWLIFLTAYARKPDSSLAPTNLPIASKLNFSASCTLMFNLQHA